VNHSEENKSAGGPAEWFTRFLVAGAAKVIKKTAFLIYTTILVGLISLLVGVSIFAVLALIGSAVGPVVAMILGAVICCALLLGPVPGWIKSLVHSLHSEFVGQVA
jgi:hypothetical protein